MRVIYPHPPMHTKLKKWCHSKKNALYDSNIISGNNSRILGNTQNRYAALFIKFNMPEPSIILAFLEISA